LTAHNLRHLRKRGLLKAIKMGDKIGDAVFYEPAAIAAYEPKRRKKPLPQTSAQNEKTPNL
jgi:hypothetical protein